MKITIVGTGYVGLVSGACFAEMGIEVTCVDSNIEKVARLRSGQMPIYEPGLAELVTRNSGAGRLHFTSELDSALTDAEAVFIAVGTPEGEDGSADLSHVLDVAHQIGRLLDHYTVVAIKSTVPVGTSERVREAIAEELKARGVDVHFDMASNPEFLKEGAAIKDFMTPDRVVVGTDSSNARQLMEQLYLPFMLNNYRIIFTDIPSAEMIKYAANSMLATRISFMNDIANLCELVGADVNMVRKGVGSDSRIGSKFLYPGCGYGGSCFPKDIKALIRTAEQYGYSMELLKAVEGVNERQKGVLFRKLYNYFEGNLADKTIAVWGLAFKPETDDMREAPSLVLIEKMLEAGCTVRVYDPAAMAEAERRLGDKVVYCSTMYEAVEGADAMMMLTEWKQFRLPSWSTLAEKMRRRVIIDGRNIYNADDLEEVGFTYLHI
ncbi:MAG: UDP-glucose/GDP-mannose dehydrogenase family protein [Alistipes sp.]|nr:UDP-glucose/GDP-mannose dehydrogenase family protein [Alistipes sp.]